MVRRSRKRSSTTCCVNLCPIFLLLLLWSGFFSISLAHLLRLVRLVWGYFSNCSNLLARYVAAARELHKCTYFQEKGEEFTSHTKKGIIGMFFTLLVGDPRTASFAKSVETFLARLARLSRLWPLFKVERSNIVRVKQSTKRKKTSRSVQINGLKNGWTTSWTACN